MKITNWLKAGRQSKKYIKVIDNYHFNPKGQLGESKWDDYVQITFYSKDIGRFMRLTMTPDEARRMKNKLEQGLNKTFDSKRAQECIYMDVTGCRLDNCVCESRV